MNTIRKQSLAPILGRTLLVALLIGGVAYAVQPAKQGNQNAIGVVPSDAVQALKQRSRAFAAIEKVTSPAVVSIAVEKQIKHSGSRQIPFSGKRIAI